MDDFKIQLDQFLEDEITELLQSLENEFQRYFPQLTEEQETLERTLFVQYFSARGFFNVKSVT